jgi:hypothetical protein
VFHLANVRKKESRGWFPNQRVSPVNCEGTTYGQAESGPDWNIAENGLLSWRKWKFKLETRKQKLEGREVENRQPVGSFQVGQTAKARLGLPCAVTPLRDMAAGSLSNQSKNLRDARANVCSVVDRETENTATGRGAECVEERERRKQKRESEEKERFRHPTERGIFLQSVQK